MSLFQKKKLLRDRAQGLAFGWRNQGASSPIVVIAALVVTALGVLFLFFGLSVKAPITFSEKKENIAIVSYISESHPQLASASQLYSPLPPRWDPLGDDTVMERVWGRLHRDIVTPPKRKVKLIPPKPLELDVTLPLIAGETDILPKIQALKKSVKPQQGECSLALNIHNEELSARLTNELEYKGTLLWDDRGKSATYFVMVDELGVVQLCSPAGSQELPGVEAWIRTLKFTPTETVSAISKFEVTIEGRVNK